jgi:glycosyltransferase involved in cell wall biosynthesis
VRIILDATFLTDLRQNALRQIVGEFDVVVANTIASWPMVAAARAQEVPVIWYIHETRVGVWLMEQIAQIRPTLREADLIITPTRETARIYEPLTLAPVHVVPYGIPESAAPAKAASELTRFLVLGSYERRKGQDVMLSAIAACRGMTARAARSPSRVAISTLNFRSSYGLPRRRCRMCSCSVRRIMRQRAR